MRDVLNEYRERSCPVRAGDLLARNGGTMIHRLRSELVSGRTFSSTWW